MIDWSKQDTAYRELLEAIQVCTTDDIDTAEVTTTNGILRHCMRAIVGLEQTVRDEKKRAQGYRDMLDNEAVVYEPTPVVEQEIPLPRPTITGRVKGFLGLSAPEKENVIILKDESDG